MKKLKDSNIEIIIIKYINNEATPEELVELNEAVKTKEIRDLLESYIQTDYSVNSNLKELDSKKAYYNFKNSILKKKEKKSLRYKRLSKVLKYAAVVTLLIGTTISVRQFNKTGIDVTAEVILEMNDGSVEVIKSGEDKIIVKNNSLLIKQDKGMIVYKKTKQDFIKRSFNKLSVPKGKRFSVKLSDGTLVHLNSGSTLKYPISFEKGMRREVVLEGEGIFEVAKDKDHAFIVKANNITTEVFGTVFNISSYKNNENQFVVLLEGSVGVRKSGISEELVMITPNEKATIGRLNNTISVEQVDVEDYVAWKKGVLKFKNERFENIALKLERHYNVSIEINNSTLNDTKFTGTFDIENIDEVLSAFKTYRNFKYEKKGSKIIINK